ncbi:MAG: JAB domain-containing protein, partial [Pseudohongiellaceae bacterium]
ASLSDAELLAIFLRTGTKGFSALDLARLLLKRFGGIRGILEAEADEFCQQHGLGLSKYVQLQAVQELMQRHYHPSGVAEPSEADIAITRRLKSALELVDIKTLDHLVVGDTLVTSMAERGLL